MKITDMKKSKKIPWLLNHGSIEFYLDITEVFNRYSVFNSISFLIIVEHLSFVFYSKYFTTYPNIKQCKYEILSKMLFPIKSTNRRCIRFDQITENIRHFICNFSVINLLPCLFYLFHIIIGKQKIVMRSIYIIIFTF